MHMSAEQIHSAVSPIVDFIFDQGSLKPLTFEERNIKLAEQWRSLDENERQGYIERARSKDILDYDTRLKRKLNKIRKNVRVDFNLGSFTD